MFDDSPHHLVTEKVGRLRILMAFSEVSRQVVSESGGEDRRRAAPQFLPQQAALGVPPEVSFKPLAKNLPGHLARRVALQQDRGVVVHPDGPDPSRGIVAVGHDIAGTRLATDPTPGEIEGVAQDEVALPVLHEASLDVILALDNDVLVGAAQKIAGWIEVEGLGRQRLAGSVRDGTPQDAPKRVSGNAGKPPERITAASQMPGGAELMLRRLAPEIDLLNDATDRIASEMVALAALIGDADESFLGVVVVSDTVPVRLLPSTDQSRAEILELRDRPGLVPILRQPVLRVVTALHLAATLPGFCEQPPLRVVPEPRRTAEWISPGDDLPKRIALDPGDATRGVDQRGQTSMGIVEHRDVGRMVTRYLRDVAGDLLSMPPDQPAMPSVNRVSGTSTGWLRNAWHGGIRYAFDGAGNLVSRDGAGLAEDDAFGWDGHNRLVRSSVGGVESAYGYDPLGRRVFKETNGDRVSFGWDGDMLAQEMRPEPQAPGVPSDAARSREFVYYAGSFVPLAMIDRRAAGDGRNAPPVAYHYHNDPNGCPVRLTDARGDVVWSARYTALGKAEQIRGSIDNPLRLQGQYEDAETRLHYNRHRYYDPSIGSYISQDPIRTEASINLYAYGPNAFAWINPVGLEIEWVDPNTLNFSQAYVTGETTAYEEAMRKPGGWDWNKFPEGHPKQSALTVIEVNGQLVSMDNRRLLAAQNAEVKLVPVVRVDPKAPKPGGGTWGNSLEKRLNSAPKGSGLPKIQLPPEGTKKKPRIVPCK